MSETIKWRPERDEDGRLVAGHYEAVVWNAPGTLVSERVIARAWRNEDTPSGYYGAWRFRMYIDGASRHSMGEDTLRSVKQHVAAVYELTRAGHASRERERIMGEPARQRKAHIRAAVSMDDAAARGDMGPLCEAVGLARVEHEITPLADITGSTVAAIVPRDLLEYALARGYASR